MAQVITEQPPVYAALPETLSSLPAVSGCPPGLEYLLQLDQVLVYQQVDLSAALISLETENKFQVYNSLQQPVYFAAEDSGCCERLFCSILRGFVFRILDNNKQEVLRVKRDYRCCAGCLGCPCDTCLYLNQVLDGNGQILGYIKDMHWCCSPCFQILDDSMNVIAEIRLPCCPVQSICFSGDLDFPIVNPHTDVHLGTLSKVWAGAVQSACTKANNFRLNFPITLPPTKKALMLSAVFIVGVMVFEAQQKGAQC